MSETSYSGPIARMSQYYVPIARMFLRDDEDRIVVIMPLDIADAIGRIYGMVGGSPSTTRRGYFDAFHKFYYFLGFGKDSKFSIEGNIYFNVNDVVGASVDGFSNKSVERINKTLEIHRQGDTFLVIMPLEIADALRDVLHNLQINGSEVRAAFDALKEMAEHLDTILPMESRKDELSPTSTMITLRKRGI